MTAADKTPSAQVLRAMDMLEALTGHVVSGMSNKDLAAALQTSPANVTRTADQLVAKGWVEKDAESGRFRITARFSRLTFRVADSFERAHRVLDEKKRNHTLSDD